MLTRADGVGPKLASRIANELRDKVAAMDVKTARVALMPTAGEPARHSAAEEAISALVNLGYRRAEAAGAVSGAARRLGPEATIEGQIHRPWDLWKAKVKIR